jgi:hypothetical protein
MKMQVFASDEAYGLQVKTRNNWPLSWRVHFDLHTEKVRSEEVVIAFGKEAIVLMSTSSGKCRPKCQPLGKCQGPLNFCDEPK